MTSEEPEKRIERYLYQYIPLSAAMGVQVRTATLGHVKLAAPLRPNVNHTETVFGGSAAALATLSAWTLLHLRLEDAGLDARLVAGHLAAEVVGGEAQLGGAALLDPDERRQPLPFRGPDGDLPREGVQVGGHHEEADHRGHCRSPEPIPHYPRPMPRSKSKRSRYTPPPPKKAPPSPPWVPALMFTGFGLGVLIIVLNYLGLLPGGAGNGYLFLGLGFITGGFLLATQYR